MHWREIFSRSNGQAILEKEETFFLLEQFERLREDEDLDSGAGSFAWHGTDHYCQDLIRVTGEVVVGGGYGGDMGERMSLRKSISSDHHATNPNVKEHLGQSRTVVHPQCL